MFRCLKIKKSYKGILIKFSELVGRPTSFRAISYNQPSQVYIGGQSSPQLVAPSVARQAQREIHQLRLNRLTATAAYQSFFGQITFPVCPHRGNGEETAERLPLFCPKLAAERQRYFVTPLTSQMCFRTVITW